ncbi:sarcosine oxidase subunit gamma [Pedococcus sp. 5OH_020]|uniref:sarcosine oxidase subunit gamma n=1 Tax=Pedococcus sp. 5OH_020 TaxID=2989814 RepID=UPI0022E99C32|nr:sarcosine oxidase subunit gamma family protein [Pedococcus sp. 5OH_020]
MTVDHPQRRSPLAHLTAELAATPVGVSLSEVPFLTQLNLRVDPLGRAARAVEEALGATLPTAANTAVAAGDLDVLWLGPDEWLLVAPEGRQESLEKSLRQAIGTEHGAVVDLSAHRTTVELSGALARDLLAKGCSLDLHPAVFTTGSCAQLPLAQAPVLLLARDSEMPRYWLLVRTSFAPYVAAWLLDACVEYAASGP